MSKRTAPPTAAEVAAKLANLSTVALNVAEDAAANSFRVGAIEFNVPQSAALDVDAEIARINKEIDYLKGFKASVEKKLGNERFVSHAPEAVVAAERKKLADATEKLATLQASLQALS